MTERPTPRTNTETRQDEYDHVDSEFGPFAPSDFVSADFARKLERELAEAEDEIARLNQSLKSASTLYDEAKEQRDRLAERIESLRALCTTDHESKAAFIDRVRSTLDSA